MGCVIPGGHYCDYLTGTPAVSQVTASHLKIGYLCNLQASCSAGVDYGNRITSMHYNDVIMGTMASQITSLLIVYSTFYSGADQSKTSKLRVTGLCAGKSPVTGEFPAQRASNAKNVSIWWRHHAWQWPLGDVHVLFNINDKNNLGTFITFFLEKIMAE